MSEESKSAEQIAAEETERQTALDKWADEAADVALDAAIHDPPYLSLKAIAMTANSPAHLI